MPLSPTQTAGAIAIGASTMGTAAVGQTASFAGMLSKTIKSAQSQSQASAQQQYQLPDGSTVNVGQARQSARQDLNQIRTQLASLLTQNGVSAGNVKLQVGSNGQIHVLGPSGQQASITSLIDSDSQLNGLLSSAAQESKIVQAAVGVSGSGAAAQQAFSTALAALSGSQSTFTLVVTPQQASVSFRPAQ
jgi:hypothetical protein